jgi:hypothetical protein
MENIRKGVCMAIVVVALLGCRSEPLTPSMPDGAANLHTAVDLSNCQARLDQPATPSAVNCDGHLCAAPKVCTFTFDVRDCLDPGIVTNSGTFVCDGPEDCPSGQRCVSTRGATANLDATACGTAGAVVCHSTGDCDAGEICYRKSFVTSGVCSAPMC